MRKILIYKDRTGNKLYRTVIKTKGTIQYSAKNRQGKLVTKSGVFTMMKKAGILKNRRKK